MYCPSCGEEIADEAVFCPTCGEILGPNAKACTMCGTVFTPDAKAVQDQVAEDMKDSYRKTDPEDMDTQEKLDALDSLTNDADVKAALMEQLSEG